MSVEVHFLSINCVGIGVKGMVFVKNMGEKIRGSVFFRIFVALKLLLMGKLGFWYRAFHLYYDGFRQMTLGRTLWLIIGIKLFIMFAVLKVFFFPNFLKEKAGKGGEADFVATEFVERVEG